MEEFSSRIFQREDDKDSKQESGSEKKKSTSARQIGAFAKQTVGSNPQSEKIERYKWFTPKKEDEEEINKNSSLKKAEKEQAKQQEQNSRAKEHTPEELNPPTPEIIEAVKRKAAIAHIDNELAAIAVDFPENAEHHAASTHPVHTFLSAVKARLQSGEESVDPLIETEAQKRLIQAEEISTNELLDEYLSPTEHLENPLVTEVISTMSTVEDGEPSSPTPTPFARPSSRTSITPTPPTAADSTTPSSSPSYYTEAASGGISTPDLAVPPLPHAETIPNITAPAPKERERPFSKKYPSYAGVALFTGYALGRRGGRKRTEAKLQPKVDTLEKEKTETVQLLTEKEQVLQQTLVDAAKHTERQAQKHPEISDSRINMPPQNMERRAAKEVVQKIITFPEQLHATTEQHTPPQLQRPETLPVISPLQKETKKHETTKPKTEQIQTATPELTQKKIEYLSTPELLKEVEHVYLDGVKVRTLYNVNRIDRAGLVKIAKASARGEDLKKVFEEVELGRERQLERAKEFRHDDTHLQNDPSSAHTSLARPHQKVGRVLMQDVYPSSPQPLKPHPQLHIPENATSSDLDATHQDETPQRSPTKTTLAISAAIAIFLAVASAIILLT